MGWLLRRSDFFLTRLGKFLGSFSVTIHELEFSNSDHTEFIGCVHTISHGFSVKHILVINKDSNYVEGQKTLLMSSNTWK